MERVDESLPVDDADAQGSVAARSFELSSTPQSEPAPLGEIVASRLDWRRLRLLPWGYPLEEWPEHGVEPLTIRRGESRHQVLFVAVGGRRYAIKETSPGAAAKEIDVFEELQRRHCRSLEPVGYVVTSGAPIPVGEMGGRTLYMSGDTGYCITRLAERVLPQSILYRYPFTEANKRMLWNAIAQLLLDLHESGVYWGDPSLANILMDLSGQRLTAVMADAETAEVVNGTLDVGLRRQDLDAFAESLVWLAEDIRLARDLPEDTQLVTETDADYLRRQYNALRADRLRAERQRSEAGHGTLFTRLRAINRRVEHLNGLGYDVLNLGMNLGMRALRPVQDSLEVGLGNLESMVTPPARQHSSVGTAIAQVATLRPAWYVKRVQALLGVRVPRLYAQRIYHHINVHKWVMSERAGHDVGMETAARDWFQHYHLPTLAFLDTLIPGADNAAIYAAYVEILDHTWEMSEAQHRAVPLEEGAMDYALGLAEQPGTTEIPVEQTLL